MRKLFFIVGLIAVFATVSFGAMSNFTLMTAATATGAGTGVSMEVSKSIPPYTCVVTWGGTTPTNTVVAIEGSIDNSTYAALSTVTVTTTGTMFHIADKPAQYLRANYVSKSGGDATTSVTVVCGSVRER